MSSTKPLLRVLDGNRVDPPPIWLMRQAGRFLPEYRVLRARCEDFMRFIHEPSMAVQATLQPVHRFGFDAAILFSDILVIPDALGWPVTFIEGEGPRLRPIDNPSEVSTLRADVDLNRLSSIFETIERAKSQLPPACAMVGFCGAPWTVASYMIGGRSTPDLASARLFAYRYPEAFHRLIDQLVDASIAYVICQFEAGIEAAQIFESWASAIPESFIEDWSLGPIRRIVAGVRRKVKSARFIVFAKGCPLAPGGIAKATGAHCVGLDWGVDPGMVERLTEGRRIALQGNLDPMALVAGGEALEVATDRVLRGFASCPHIFNLGHGVVPQTPVENVASLVDKVRRFDASTLERRSA
jgi:uroporphyrinogen decarboxylase